MQLICTYHNAIGHTGMNTNLSLSLSLSLSLPLCLSLFLSLSVFLSLSTLITLFLLYTVLSLHIHNNILVIYWSMPEQHTANSRLNIYVTALYLFIPITISLPYCSRAAHFLLVDRKCIS